MVQSKAPETIDLLGPDKEIKVSRTGVSDLIEATRSTGLESRPSIGLGTDLRLDSRNFTGFAPTLDGLVVTCWFLTASKMSRKAGGIPEWEAF